jgi:hypothetical protein
MQVFLGLIMTSIVSNTDFSKYEISFSRWIKSFKQFEQGQFTEETEFQKPG